MTQFTLSQLCQQLALPAVAATVDQACESAQRQQQPYAGFLLDLLHREWKHAVNGERCVASKKRNFLG